MEGNYKSSRSNQVDPCDGLSQEWLLMRGAQDLRENDILVDVVLVVDGIKMAPCHKFILAASSPYFRAMFSHGMVEQDKTEIDMMGIDQLSMRLVLDYIYTAKINITDENVQGLMTACSLLQITGLYAKCRDYMIKRMDVSNCVSVYQYARSMFCTKLEEESYRFIVRRFNDISNTTEFLTLNKNEFIDIISSDDLWITKEESVYEVAIQWLATDIIGRSHHIAEIFSHVRFALVDENYLNSCVIQEDLILESPQLRVQIDAAKTYLSKLNNSEVAHCEDDEKDADSSVEMDIKFPSYTVPVDGLENAIRIPLCTTPRAGMNTKEFVLFTNGRKTFVMNPKSTTEYYGCVDGKPPTNMGNTFSARSYNGWASDIPLMKNPEAYVTQDGTTYLLGGLEVEKCLPPKVRTRVYTLEQDALGWSPCSSLPMPRCMAAYGDGCGHLYVLGGKALSQGEVVSNVHKYNNIDNVWEEVQPMPLALYGHSAASLNDKIYTIGGKSSSKVLQSRVHILECTTHQWTEIETISVPRFLHGVSVNRDSNEIIIVGGSGEEGVLNSVEVYNETDGRWRFGESFPGNRCAQFIMYFDNELHAIGGYVTERNESGRYESREMHDVFVLERSSNQWKRKVRRVKGTTGCAMACVKVLLNVTKMPRVRTLVE